MKIFTREQPFKHNINVDLVTSDTKFDIKIYVEKDLTSGEMMTEPLVVQSFNFSDITYDSIMYKDESYDHAVYAIVWSRLEKKLKSINILKHSLESKSGIGSSGYKKNGYSPLIIAFVPYKNSPISDWTFVVGADTLTVDGVQVTQSYNIDHQGKNFGETCNELLPSISLTNNDGIISAQLISFNGANEAKNNVEIYFETTAGYLTKGRALTNADGIATTTVVGAEEGKVKAGFKYFSGKTEITI
jgi:hypothetical protein